MFDKEPVIQVISLWRKLKLSFIHLVYPARCLHCREALPPDFPQLCEVCASLLELISPQGRCHSCFTPLREEFAFLCQECLHHPSSYCYQASAFYYEGPAATLVKRLKYGNQPYLAKGMAAFLVVQFDQLQWLLPDALVPVPISPLRWLERGYNQTTLLAEEMGKLLQLPTWNALKRDSGGYSQAALTLEQRKTLDPYQFRLKSTYSIKNKTLLVIDDVMTSGSTLQRCAEALQQGQPAALYALTFCRTRTKFH
jgi:ComF family protein